MKQQRKQADNLIPYADTLRDTEFSVIRMAVSTYGSEHVHKGSQLFINRLFAIKCLQSVVSAVSASSDAQIRVAKRIIEKLQSGDTAKPSFQMLLKHAKVERYGREITKGKFEVNTGLSTKVECGIRWDHFKKRYIKPEAVVTHRIVLQRTATGAYDVFCDAKVVDMVRNLLFERYR